MEQIYKNIKKFQEIRDLERLQNSQLEAKVEINN